ncbi:unnamed protein product [Paramecium primaurelia]|uniref:Uncharacterized protein n=1 Tax=Paramecium primaurelia TaxID=5886 RepID=A0A8S1KYT5_PARPR|nr:unnamed protein product [Paramecium primaurelia]
MEKNEYLIIAMLRHQKKNITYYNQLDIYTINCRTVKQKKQQNQIFYDDVRPGPVTQIDLEKADNELGKTFTIENRYLKWEKESGSC